MQAAVSCQNRRPEGCGIVLLCLQLGVVREWDGGRYKECGHWDRWGGRTKVNICSDNVHMCRVTTFVSTNRNSMMYGHNSLGTMTCSTRHKSGAPTRP